VNGTFLLEMNHVREEFPGVIALKDVSVALCSGEVHALLGGNGAGKSTRIKVLGGIYAANTGDIRINGKPVSINSIHDAHNNGISVIYQELVLVVPTLRRLSTRPSILILDEPAKGVG
jgi:ribose transport system ATP-binding protein